jgi:hypothetical protein
MTTVGVMAVDGGANGAAGTHDRVGGGWIERDPVPGGDPPEG